MSDSDIAPVGSSLPSSDSSSITGAELLVECLRAEGVRVLFGLADIGFGPILKAAEAAGMRVVSGRHEAAQVHMADAWARATTEPAATVGATGPGAANMLSGVLNAYAEGIPLLVIATQRNDRATRSVRRGRFQFTPQLHVFAQTTKFAGAIPDARRIPEYVREAFRHMYTGRPGPVYLEIGDDIVRESTDARVAQVWGPSQSRPAPPAPDTEMLGRVVDELTSSSFPLIVAGQGVRWSGASRELLEVVEASGALVTTTMGARGVVPEDHPQAVIMASPGGTNAARRADLVVAIGTSVGEMLGYGRPPRWGEYGHQKWVQIDVDPLQIGVNRPVDIGIVSDARSALAALCERLRCRGREGEASAPAPAAQQCVDLCRSARRMLREGFGNSDAFPIHPARLAREVAAAFPDDSIACLDGGCTAMWAHMFHTFSRPDSLLWTSHFGHLGTGLPYALGAKAAFPDRLVYLVTGDGALGFNLQELETAARHGLAVVVVVACDYKWGMEVLGQRLELGRTIGTDHLAVRYDEVAKALGWDAELVSKPDEIASALERARTAVTGSNPRPYLLQVEVDPEANANPPGLMEFARMYAAQDA